MKKFEIIKSNVIPLEMDNVDTDMIIPAQYLTKVSRSGYGEYLFQRLREQDDNFVFNKSFCRSAQILLTRSNFGCGSSREHAVWALNQYGIKVIIAESYSDIFYSNAPKNGLLLIKFSRDIIDFLMLSCNDKGCFLHIDLERQCVITASGVEYYFDYCPYYKECFLEGKDDIDYILERIS